MALKTFEYRGFTFLPCAYQGSPRWYVKQGIMDEQSCPKFGTKAECREYADQQAAFNAAAAAERAQLEAQFANLPIDE